MSEENTKKDRKEFWIFAAAWSMILLWRLFICIQYSFQYTDDDQALMWYGTVHFAHGHFPEPCFFGQNYGSMIESLLAVPLYLCGWPLKIALPLISSLLGLLPFFAGSIAAKKKGDDLAAWVIMLILSGTGWMWDILTSVPRSFIPGLTIGVLGITLLHFSEKKHNKFLAVFISVTGCVITESAIAVFGVGMLSYVMKKGKEILKKSEWGIILAGILPGVGVAAFTKLFYVFKADYALYHSQKMGLNFDVFYRNLTVLYQRLSEYCFAGKAGWVIIPVAVVAAVVIAVKNGDRQGLVLMIVSVAGSAIMLAMERSYSYDDDSLLYGQLRMLLYWAYLVLTIILCSVKKGRSGVGIRKAALFTGLIMVMISVKSMIFKAELDDAGSCIYNASFISFMKTDELERQAAILDDIAERAEADVLVCTSYARVMCYGMAALYYDRDYDVYIPDHDRRYWIWEKMNVPQNRKVLFYSMPVGPGTEYSLLELKDMSVVQFFDENYNIGRDKEYEWGTPWDPMEE